MRVGGQSPSQIILRARGYYSRPIIACCLSHLQPSREIICRIRGGKVLALGISRCCRGGGASWWHAIRATRQVKCECSELRACCLLGDLFLLLYFCGSFLFLLLLFWGSFFFLSFFPVCVCVCVCVCVFLYDTSTTTHVCTLRHIAFPGNSSSSSSPLELQTDTLQRQPIFPAAELEKVNFSQYCRMLVCDTSPVEPFKNWCTPSSLRRCRETMLRMSCREACTDSQLQTRDTPSRPVFCVQVSTSNHHNINGKHGRDHS